MIPIDFPQATRTYSRPAGWTDEQCAPLRVCEVQYADGTMARLSCWKPNWRDRLRLLFGGPIWLHIIGRGQPPVYVGTEQPFDPPASRAEEEKKGKEDPAPAPAPSRLPVVIGEASDGWHVALATYPASMDTACGKKGMPATQFETTDAARGHTFCIACLNAWEEQEIQCAPPEAT